MGQNVCALEDSLDPKCMSNIPFASLPLTIHQSKSQLTAPSPPYKLSTEVEPKRYSLPSQSPSTALKKQLLHSLFEMSSAFVLRDSCFDTNLIKKKVENGRIVSLVSQSSSGTSILRDEHDLYRCYCAFRLLVRSSQYLFHFPKRSNSFFFQ